MQLRRHENIIAIKAEDSSSAIAFHSSNMQVAQVSEETWNSMAPTSFSNGFAMKMDALEVGVQPDAYAALEEWQQETDPNVKTRQFQNRIQSLTLNVTQLCNLHCTYCAAGGDGTYGDPVAKISIEKTIPQLGYFFSKLNKGQSFHISFLGGEPLLYPEALRTLALAAQQLAEEKGIELSLSVITNGTLITEKTLTAIKNLNLSVTISLDGAPEQHDKARPQRNGEGSSAKAYSGLELLLKNKDSFNSIRIHGVFSKDNMGVLQAYRYFRQYAVDSYELTFDITETDPLLTTQFLTEMTEVARLAYESGGESELRKIILFEAYFSALDLQTRTENHCGTGKSLISLDARNKMYSCPLEVGVSPDIQTDELHSMSETLVEKNNCQTCWARFLCGGGCLFAHRSMTGNKHKKHLSYCERTRYLISLALLYYEKSRS